MESTTDVVPAGTESLESLIGKAVAEPTRAVGWRRHDAEAAKRAQFRLYLGAAPGVGKTFAMLGEGQRRHGRGTDVVVGIVETYGRPHTRAALEGLEAIPPRLVEYRGSTFEELDTEALVARKPEVALIDELAHTGVPGSRRSKRWEDVVDVLAAGIAVISTVNIQHLESVNDVVTRITGIRQQETVPDWVVDLADDVEIVDIAPQALRRRMMHGNIYPDARKAELALERYFTLDNLTALRELALMRVANQVDDALLARWSKEITPETRERVLVCVAYPTFTDDLVRRGARIAQRARGDLLVLHVQRPEQRPPVDWLEQVRTLTEALGGEFEVVEADSAVEGVLAYAYKQHVTQLVVGEPLRSKWSELIRGSFVNRLIRRASNIDVHVIARRSR